MTRPTLTWLALWLGIASAVAVGIVAGFLLLRLLAPDVAIAASRPVAQPTVSSPVSILQDAGMPVDIPQFEPVRSAAPSAVGNNAALHQPRTPSPDPIPASDRVLARANEAPTGSPLVLVAPSVRRPNVAAGVTEPRARITGTASWFAYIPGGAAAGPALRSALGPGWRGMSVAVLGPAGWVRVVLSDWMRADKLIDLASADFPSVCGPLSRGICEVEVTW